MGTSGKALAKVCVDRTMRKSELSSLPKYILPLPSCDLSIWPPYSIGSSSFASPRRARSLSSILISKIQPIRHPFTSCRGRTRVRGVAVCCHRRVAKLESLVQKAQEVGGVVGEVSEVIFNFNLVVSGLDCFLCYIVDAGLEVLKSGTRSEVPVVSVWFVQCGHFGRG